MAAGVSLKQIFPYTDGSSYKADQLAKVEDYLLHHAVELGTVGGYSVSYTHDVSVSLYLTESGDLLEVHYDPHFYKVEFTTFKACEYYLASHRPPVTEENWKQVYEKERAARDKRITHGTR